MEGRATDKNKSSADRSAPSAAEIRTQLVKISDSPGFQKAARLREFLHFVVNEKLDDRADNLKAYTIGLEVFDRPGKIDSMRGRFHALVPPRLERRHIMGIPACTCWYVSGGHIEGKIGEMKGWPKEWMHLTECATRIRR
ncbi:MAG: hypothetical protein QNI95_18885 [Desulfobacterales bacterium]|nr:hypothetical protein [Desulfobacterales bacterium]